ncbi:hypothetical protein APHAL10511_008038 [Amanita phalloides]|nr:hypothetical protein APHAL10511_008038 [Amanita phalloides]
MHEQPSSLALEEFMLLDDEDDRFGGNDLAKLSDIQEQLQKQADLIRDLINQRDYLITQIFHERERWQVERDGWDRTSEALIARYSRKANNPVKDEEMTHRCALYESDNKFLKEKVHDAQVRVSDLEAELSRLRPLLLIQPRLRPRPRQQEPTRSADTSRHKQLQNSITSISHAPPPTPAVSYAAFSPYTTPPTDASDNSNRKRKRDNDIAGKGKEKEAFNENASDANADDDSDDTDTPPTPTPVSSSASRNPYAYMNNLYRKVLSPPKIPATLPSSPFKSTGSLNGVPLGTVGSSPTGPIPFNRYAVAYPPYPFPATTRPKQPSSSIMATSLSTSSRQGSAEKGIPNTESAGNGKAEPSPALGSARKAGTTSVQRTQQTKYKTSSMLSDARAEHLLLAARKIGRERAVSLAGFLKTWERSTFEEAKDKAKVKDDRHSEINHSSASAGRSAQRRRAPVIRSPTTPTPKRTHGPTKSLTDVSSFALTPDMTPNISKTRETLFGSSKTPRSKSFNVSGGSTSKNDGGVAGAGQTSLDSLLSAARTMMTEDRDSRRTSTGKNAAPDDGTKTSQDASERWPSAEDQSWTEKESASRPKRRRNTASRGTTVGTPRSRNVEVHATDGSNSHEREAEILSPPKLAAGGQTSDAMTTSMRRRSALDVLADQAAAAFEGSSTTQQGMDQEESADLPSNTSLLTMTTSGVVAPHECPDATPVSRNAAAEITASRKIERSAKPADHERTGKTQTIGASLQHFEPQQCGRENDLVGEVAVAIVEGPAENEPNILSNSEPGNEHKDCDPFGGRLMVTESGGDSECDLDAEGDIDPDSQDTIG